MERSRLLECLADDYARLREVAASDLTATVPSCPGWTVADLVRHVAEVYLHKVACMRLNAFPDPWPPAGLQSEGPIELLDRAYAELAAEFAARDATDPSRTWHEPDQTVGFWIRRMAQETVIHRLDAELALDVPVAAIPDDLAVDGIDEVLKLFVGYGSHAWLEDFQPVLAGATGRTVIVGVNDGPGWLIRTEKTGADVSDADPATAASTPLDATVSGDAAGVLRWLWARESPGRSDVQAEGDEATLTELRNLLVASTQ
ncbi:maleylpyruvate isomerase family mycothiol-dependent enzyme [Dactylosporangium siamense]|uniref:maleylpyruvate isomerase family mycothiol-dependent enzyme n=1 Tax=Dactylosporangium siamense TaxID=685454 RepID=UPI00194536A4|nr:maleylpyruvate isomerase family mycothiol-dependent enzyme [Dactylosporangium siamense]